MANNPAVVMIIIFTMLILLHSDKTTEGRLYSPHPFAEQHAARYNILNKGLTSILMK